MGGRPGSTRSTSWGHLDKRIVLCPVARERNVILHLPLAKYLGSRGAIVQSLAAQHSQAEFMSPSPAAAVPLQAESFLLW